MVNSSDSDSLIHSCEEVTVDEQMHIGLLSVSSL
jgi:hypothetical protein